MVAPAATNLTPMLRQTAPQGASQWRGEGIRSHPNRTHPTAAVRAALGGREEEVDTASGPS